MIFQPEETPVLEPDHLVDAVPKLETAVLYTDAALGQRQITPVDVEHVSLPTAFLCPRNAAFPAGARTDVAVIAC